MTSIFEARRAGQMPARTPAIAARIRTTTMPTTGIERTRPSSSSALTAATPIPNADHRSDDRSDHRGDHRLVADHAPDLALGGADRAQHPELALALEHREDEGDDDADEAEDHGQREQHVDQRDEPVDLTPPARPWPPAGSGTRRSGSLSASSVSISARVASKSAPSSNLVRTRKSWRVSKSSRSTEIGSATESTSSAIRSRTLPSTVASTSVPLGVVRVIVSPTSIPFSSAKSASMIAPSGPRFASVSSEPSTQSRSAVCASVAGSRPVTN